MGLSVFFIFPFNDDNEKVCEIVLDDGNNEREQLYKLVKSFKNAVTGYDESAVIYYDAENIRDFSVACCFDGNNLHKPKVAILTVLGRTKVVSEINVKIDASSKYFLWDVKNETVSRSPYVISKIIEKVEQLHENKDVFALINVGGAIDATNLSICAFKDSYHSSHLPDKFIRLPCISSIEEFDLWAKTNHVREFSLLNRSRFVRTGIVQQGKPVFEERETGYYWYLDNLHKDEYEVFDSRGQHIATADLQGELNCAGRVVGRIISI
jgi:hypothetical protein